MHGWLSPLSHAPVSSPVGCHTWTREAAWHGHSPGCYFAPLTAELPAHLTCLSHGIAPHWGFCPFWFSGTSKSNVRSRENILVLSLYLLLIRGNVRYSSKDETRNRDCILPDGKSFLFRKETLKEVELPKLIHLSGDASHTYFTSSVRITQDPGKHSYRLTFNFKFNLKVSSCSFIHLLFRCSDMCCV